MEVYIGVEVLRPWKCNWQIDKQIELNSDNFAINIFYLLFLYYDEGKSAKWYTATVHLAW